MEYYQTLAKLHGIVKPKVYLEVGVRNGESLQYAYGKALCIGIDPKYDIKFPYNKKTLLYKETSDDFFKENNVLDLTKNQYIDFAFIDGMHLFEFVLRDFISIEKFTHKHSLVVLHDCIPKDEVTSSRERKTDYWTGDVWKIIPILKKYRPDLEIKILDSKPSGLCLVTNLDKENNILHNNYKKILREYLPKIYDTNQVKEEVISTDKIHFEDIINIKEKSSRLEKLKNFKDRLRRKPRCLGVLLCYNDGDILEDSINYLLENNHDLVVWDHGSDDNTKEVLDKYNDKFLERKFVPRSFDFYNLYAAMSKNLIDNYIKEYDWISWPDQDEFLEGPNRKKSYFEHIRDVYNTECNWVRFNNINYWFTEKDKVTIKSPVERIKYYSVFPDCAPRIRSWRACVTNIREFNHNELEGKQYPVNFNLRHYPIRGVKQLKRRINKDRAGLRRGNLNVHYDNMKKNYEKLQIPSENLIFDDGGELSLVRKFDWTKVYF
jgi:hypothetical protein